MGKVAQENEQLHSIDQEGFFDILQDGGVASPQGFSAGGMHCGLKRKRKDLAWLFSDTPAVAAGVYTTNLFQAAPLKVTQDSIHQEGKLQGVLINSGNANACTGEQGLLNAYRMRERFAQKMNIPAHLAAVVSTGVIGEQLPMEKLELGIAEIPVDQALWQTEAFEQAILTTDTCTKHVAVRYQWEGTTITIGGAAKGSGMIHPNMATMLGFITSDANIEADSLQQALRTVTNQTFNRITVDGDTSTNDMVLLLANGKAGNRELKQGEAGWQQFMTALQFVSQTLAKMIARDGEGATKLIEVTVEGAATEQMAERVGKAIVGSSLVKTAIFGTDPNWGRIVCAAGYSGAPIDPERVELSLGPILLVRNGLPQPFAEEQAQQYLENELIHIHVHLHQGEARATCWGCDLTYDYVKINALYRT
jgi:glutamate N-acetyltransferase/amino-acid N-acetyltransferase